MQIKALAKIILLLGFFISTLWLFAGLPVVFNSPDESANFLFASEFVQEQDFVIEEPLNEELFGLIHPRSMLAVGDRVLPRSFLGLPFTAGAVGLIFGKNVMLFVTPVLAVLAILAWRSSIQIVFKDETLANFSAFLLMIHPAFWYYSGRTMMHNVGFLSLLIIAFWFAAKGYVSSLESSSDQRVRLFFFLSGATVSFSLAFRAAEVLWVVPVTALCLWWVRKKLSKIQLSLFVLGAVIVALPFAIFNQDLYGSILTTGYQAMEPVSELAQTLTAEPGAGAEVLHSDSVIGRVMSILFPFGIAERAILRHLWQYGFALYPWMTILTLLGIVVLALKRKVGSVFHLRWMRLLSLFTALGIWLVVVYGSWTFHDNPDPAIFSLGNSYVRYWLPLFLLSTPFAALALKEVVVRVKKPILKRLSITGVCAALLFASFSLVFFGDDGFVPTRLALKSFVEKREHVATATEPDAIVIVDRADKFLYPHRRVITPLRDELTYAAMPFIVEQAPLYYFGITLPEKDIDYLNSNKLKALGLQIEYMSTVNDESLYRIMPEL